MFTLPISCLTTSNLPWFKDLTFQVPMQYCSLQHQILFAPPDTSTTEHHFCFGPDASFFLGLLVIAVYSSPVAYWPRQLLTQGAHLLVSYLSAFSWCLWGSWVKNTGVVAISSFSGPHFVRTLHYDLSILTGPAWHMAHSFTELHKPLHREKATIYEEVFKTYGLPILQLLYLYSVSE